MAYTKKRSERHRSYNPLGIAIAVIFFLGLAYVATVLIGAGVLTSNGHFDSQSYLDVLKDSHNWNLFELFKDL